MEKRRIFILLAICLWYLIIPNRVNAQSLKDEANDKITTLENLIITAKNKGLDVLREEMTVHTAKLFLRYADWDENNVATNKKHFEKHAYEEFRDNADQMANDLPEFERQEVIHMLDEVIENFNLVIEGKIVRKDAPDIDWKQLIVEQNKITLNGKPVFLADYTWKNEIPELKRYYGAGDSEGLRAVYIKDETGTHETWAYNQWSNKVDEEIGSMWTDQNNVPDWAKTKWPDIQVGGRHYGKFDVDHAGSKEMYSLLYKHYVPLLADKKVTHLGYQLWNEPSFFTAADSWNNTDDNGVCVSDSTIKKFKVWLSNKHASIADLNQVWNTNFISFDDVKITLPMPKANQGKPIWYDWMTYNMHRITSWFTFMRDEIVKYDPDARVHIKLMPWTWSNNAKDHGLDFEALTELSGISGCDAGMAYLHKWSSTPWADRYALNWKDAIMTFDFFKSVQPNHFIYDTENHFLMNTGFTEQKLRQDYVRMAYWLGTMHGLTAKSTWVWTREGDGSMKREPGASNMTDISHQPRTLNTITTTYMDLNAYSEEMLKIQELKKPIRIFYSGTSAINDEIYMDKIFATYESVYFEGIPVGFVTEKILKKGIDWEFVIINNTEFVTQAELDALQQYLNNGGTVILDTKSLKKDEYGKTLQALTTGSGTIISANTIEEVQNKVLGLVEARSLKPAVTVSETNNLGLKGCTWRCVKNNKGNNVISVVNLGKGDAKIDVNLTGAVNGTKCIDLITGNEIAKKVTLKPYQIYFAEIIDEVPNADVSLKKLIAADMANLFPNPTTGTFHIQFKKNMNDVLMTVSNIGGQQLFKHKYINTNKITDSISNYPQGTYIVRLIAGENQQAFKLINK